MAQHINEKFNKLIMSLKRWAVVNPLTITDDWCDGLN